MPEFYDGPGQYNLSLPGNTVVPVTLTDSLMAAVILVWAVGTIAVLVWSKRQKRRLLSQDVTELPVTIRGVDPFYLHGAPKLSGLERVK